MSEIRSDNRLEKHPKPTQEFERKLVSGFYQDWVSFAEMEAVYDLAYRVNKYFWVAGVYYQCTGDHVYRQVGGGGGGGGGADIIDYAVMVDAMTIDVPELNGKEFYLLIQGLTPYNKVYIDQAGITLDCTRIGGVYAGQTLTIFFK